MKKETEEVDEIDKYAFNTIKTNKKDYIYFENIKLNLDPKKTEKNEIIETNFPIKYSIKLEIVIKEYLRKISDNALEKINNQTNFKNYTKNDIKWVVTVPAIWNEYGKQFMRDCAKKAGMNDILISLEPEAASLTMFDDPNINETLKEKDKIFMLIDAGGYTVDITLNQIVDENKNLKQLSPPSGGSYGSMNFNLEIIKIFEEMVGKDVFEKFKMKQTDDWGELLKKIEEKKQDICVGKADNINFEFNNYFTPYWTYITNINNREKEFVTKYGIIKYDNNKIYIPNSLMKEIIKKQIDKIISHIQKLINKFNYIKIDQFVLTGGFSNCYILKNNLIDTFKSIFVNQLNNPERSIAKGAALFALKPNQIISRIAPYSMGLSAHLPQRNGTECKNKKIIDNKTECEYYVPYVKKGEEIKNNLTKNDYFVPAYNNQTSLGFILYYSTLDNPVYIDENVKEIAYFGIEANETNLLRKERKVIVEMSFSSCITVTAKNIHSGKEVSIKANYYNRDE